jgi:hypothetical protein
MRQIDVPVLGMAFHRLESPTQTRSDAVKQVASGEIWGRPARGSNIPSVKAYRNALPAGQRGVEFTTTVLPQRGSGTPYEARWYYPDTPGVLRRQDANQEDYAAIPAQVINMQP